MENEYSCLLDKTYNEIFKKTEKGVKDILIEGYKTFKGFDKMFNVIDDELELRIKSLYINQNKEKFKDVIEWYGKREDEYRDGGRHLIFENQMKNSFINIQGIEDFSFNDFIIEFASHNALKEVNRIWFHSRRIYQLMYELNDYSDYKICSKFYGSPNHLIEIKRLYYKKELLEEPEKYESFESYLEKESLFNRGVNGIVIQEGNNKKDDDKVVGSFKIDKNYETILNSLFLDLLNETVLDREKTKFKDFINVLTEDWDNHKSKIVFRNGYRKQNVAYLLRVMEQIFPELKQTSIGKSNLFFWYDDNNKLKNISRTDLANNFKPMNVEKNIVSLENKIHIDEIDTLISRHFKNK